MKLTAKIIVLFLVAATFNRPGSTDDLDFVQMISLVNDELVAFNRPVGLPSCNYNGMLFESGEALTRYLKTRQSYRAVIPYAEALKIFNEFRNNKKIPFKYPEDACYARAHFMAKELEKKGIYSRKIFAEGRFAAYSSCAPDEVVTWMYHVAPIVTVKMPGGEIQDLVFDPSLLRSPAPFPQWLRKFAPIQDDQSPYCKSLPADQLSAKTFGKIGSACRYYLTERYFERPPGSVEGFKSTKMWRAEDLQDTEDEMKKYSKIAAQRPDSCLPE